MYYYYILKICLIIVSPNDPRTIAQKTITRWATTTCSYLILARTQYTSKYNYLFLIIYGRYHCQNNNSAIKAISPHFENNKDDVAYSDNIISLIYIDKSMSYLIYLLNYHVQILCNEFESCSIAV